MFTHDRIPPKRRKVPEHTGLRAFLVCDASVLIDATGTPTDDMDTILCLHPDEKRVELVTASFVRRLPRVPDIDAYEITQAEDKDVSISELYDASDNDIIEKDGDDWLPDRVLIDMCIVADDITPQVADSVHTGNCASSLV